MIRMIIADDERWNLRIIRDVLGGMDNVIILDEAGDGLTALELCHRHQPDILLTDIRMPGLDGMQLIEHIGKVSHMTKTIIISGYDEFELAKQAIGLCVSDYLLKPIDEEELRDAVRKVSNNLRAEQEHKMRIELQNQYFSYRDQVKFWIDVWHKRLGQPEIYAESAKKAGLNLVGRQLCVVLITVTNADEEEGLHLFRQAIDRTNKLMSSLFGLKFDSWICSQDELGYEFGLFLLPKKETMPSLLPSVFDGVNGLIDYTASTYNLKLVAGISDFLDISSRSMFPANLVIEQADKAFETIFFNDQEIGVYSPAIDDRETVAFFVQDEVKYRLYHALRMHDQSKFISTLNELFEEIKMHHQIYKSEDVKSGLWRFVDELAGMTENSEFDISKLYYGKSVTTGPAFFRLRSLKCAYEAVVKIAQEIQSTQVAQAEDSITIAKRYTSEHFFEDINIEMVASIVFLNPTYFSGLFKKTTGKTFLEYVTDLRMEKAKDLLSDTNIKVYEVSEQVGYTDSKYFTKLFKKYYNVTPKEFRDNILV